jgi:hypothetical protein
MSKKASNPPPSSTLHNLASKAITELKKAQTSGDPETAHQTADGVLCDLLTELGYKVVVNEYYKVPKWYA